MHLFSTVLFVDGNPVGYKVFEDQDTVQLTPVENPHRHIVAPLLSAVLIEGTWLVQGTESCDLAEQVKEDMELFFGLAHTTCFS
jgi:hypothetical protein